MTKAAGRSGRIDTRTTRASPSNGRCNEYKRQTPSLDQRPPFDAHAQKCHLRTPLNPYTVHDYSFSFSLRRCLLPQQQATSRTPTPTSSPFSPNHQAWDPSKNPHLLHIDISFFLFCRACVLRPARVAVQPPHFVCFIKSNGLFSFLFTRSMCMHYSSFCCNCTTAT